jgi:hypothetical protein
MQQDHSSLNSFVVHTNLQPVKLFCAFYFFHFSTICLFCASWLTSNCSSSSEKLPDRLVELGTHTCTRHANYKTIFHFDKSCMFIAINIPSDVMTIITTADVGLKSELVERGF